MPSAREGLASNMQVLPTITTITPGLWQKKIKEVKKLKLEEIALFPTCLKKEERKKLYQLLKETSVKSIPFIHLRSDVTEAEIDYLIKNYQTKVFNTHSKREYPFLYDYSEYYKKLIYIENTYDPLDENEIKEFAGICLDLAHLENTKVFNKKNYEHNIKLIEKYSCGCNHIGPTKNFSFLEKKNLQGEHPHYLKDLSEIDYLKNYPMKYFSSFMALELENTIEEQLKIKEYIANLL